MEQRVVRKDAYWRLSAHMPHTLVFMLARMLHTPSKHLHTTVKRRIRMHKQSRRPETSPGEWTRPGPPRRARCSTKLPLPPYSTSCRAEAGSSHQTPFGSCLPLLLAPETAECGSLGLDPAGRARTEAGSGRRGVADVIQGRCGGNGTKDRALSALLTGCDTGKSDIGARGEQASGRYRDAMA